MKLDLDWRSRNRPAFQTLYQLSPPNRHILYRTLFTERSVGRIWLSHHFPEVVRRLDGSSRERDRDGATAVYTLLDIVDELAHLDPELCPRKASLSDLADLLLQGTDGGSIPEILLAPLLLATLKLAFGTVGVTVELKNQKEGDYSRTVELRNRTGGRMAYPRLYPQKWERADQDRFIDFTIKVYDADSSDCADRVDIEVQSRKWHGDTFRSPRYSTKEGGPEVELNEDDLRKFTALAAMPWPIDPVLVTGGAVNDDPLAVAVGITTHLAHRCTERWAAAVADLP